MNIFKWQDTKKPQDTNDKPTYGERNMRAQTTLQQVDGAKWDIEYYITKKRSNDARISQKWKKYDLPEMSFR